ncbi:uncharacterized protein LOC108227404 isoform X1 [Daucus carota subsp. sativus]|uniref:uncharacterized protein LOC108227404 isoform X1 n=1 Tax=Daucus carota subsp. sativus TaxID=79200 RepID=UPI0007EFC4AD|nr:PREDICTED: serine/arginine repetitive matrix protein 2-like isoform X1 [Daucus carota subsp. sativus]
MYGPGNFPPQRGQGPEISVATSQSVQPHLPQPPYQHGNGNRTQHSQFMERGPSYYPAPDQAYPPTYANEHHIPTTGMSNSGQSYLLPLSAPPAPPPHTQGHSAPIAHPFPGPQQNSQWAPNVQHVPPPLLPTFGCPPPRQNGPEMLLPPPPPRLQPPMLSQGQALFRGFVPSPLPGPVQGLQHTPLAQPPPQNITSYTHGHFGSVVNPISEDPNGSSAGLLPPPPPPSPPPGPPPPPVASPPQASPSSHSKSVGANQHNVPQEDVQPSDSPSRSVQDGSLVDAGQSYSPADSNMDIEDEMTEIDENQRCSEIVDGKSVLVSSECEVEKELHEPQISAKNTSSEEPAFRNTLFLNTSEFADHKEGAGVVDKNVSTELGTGTSAFKLLQDYASEDDSDHINDRCDKDIAQAPVNPSGGSLSAAVESEKGSSFVMNETRNPSESEMGFGQSSEHVLSLPASLQSKTLDSSLGFRGPSREVDKTVIVKDKKSEDNRDANQLYFNTEIADKDFEQKSYVGSNVRPASNVGKRPKEDGDSQLKVDEFGRLIKEGGSDSEDLSQNRRHDRRGRIRSRSRSPHDRRRSPQRRRHRRSRSRSWSPRKRRSRSRSPSRHRAQYGTDRTRWDKVPSAACFDYKRGKCYRGASCRYSHGDSTMNELSRGYRSKNHKSQEKQLSRELSEKNLGASMDYNVDQKEVAPVRNISDKDVDLLISSVAKSVRTREEAAQVQETEHARDDRVNSSIHDTAENNCVEGVTPKFVGSYVVDHGTDVNARRLPPGNTCHGTESSVVQNSQANLVSDVLQNADHQAQPMEAPSARDPESLPATEAHLNSHSVPEPHPDTVSYQLHPATASVSKSYSSDTFSTHHLRSGEQSPKKSYYASQFLPPPPPTSEDANTPQMPRDCIVMPQSSRYQSLPTPPDSFAPHRAPFPKQLANFTGPYSPSLDNESTVRVSSSYGLPSSQFQENELPSRNDYPPQVLVGTYSTEMNTYLQAGESHGQSCPPTQQPNQPLSHIEDNKSTGLPTVSTTTQQFGEGGLTSLPGYTGQVSSAGEHLSSSSQRYSHLQQPMDALQHLTDESGSVARKPGKTNSEILSYNSEYFRRNLPSHSHVPDFVGSRIPTYCNPYGSICEQPASLKVSLNVVSEAKGMPLGNGYGDPFSSSHVSADARVADSIESKNLTCFPNSNQAVEKMLPNSIGDQYDPLFDSIEPSSNLYRIPNNGQKHEITGDSDMKMNHSDSNKPLDFAENTEQREAEAVAVMSSLDNDEYGETAEAEVGAVENGSQSDPVHEANTAAEENEIDQVITSGRNKIGKDSRSMKLFKAALADFVKEVLKPSWRQGNMSKEAFKTIVKKTVDKVCGAMKSHQIPKSQTKIDHYIDSSQRKLTKLVMGYVDKYVKV